MPRPPVVIFFALSALCAGGVSSRCAAKNPSPAAGPSRRGSSLSPLTRTAARLSAPLDARDDPTDLEYRRAYLYAVACLAGMGGDLADQAALLKRAEQSDPASRLLARQRAVVLLRLGRGSEAAEVLKRALVRAPGDEDLRRELCGIYEEQHRPDEARALFLKPDGSDPTDPVSLRALIALDFEAGDYGSALRRLRALLSGGRGDTDDRALLGLTLQVLKRPKQAAAAYRRVLALDPTRTEVWGRLAECDRAAGETNTAVSDLAAGLKANPRSPLLADDAGRLLYRVKDYAAAEHAFELLVALDPGDAHALMFRGLARLELGRAREAEADFRAVGKLDKGDPDQAYALGLALLAQKKYAPAMEQFHRVLALDPQTEDAWIDLAFVQEHLKMGAAAEATLAKGIQAVPDSRDLPLLLSGIQEDSRQTASAEKTLRAALRRGDGGGQLRFQLAVLLDKTGDFPAAQRQLSRLLVEDPRNAEALNYLGYSWVERGEKLKQAEALIRRALAVDPGNRYYLDSLGWSLYKQHRFKEALAPLLQAAKDVANTSDADEAVVWDHLAATQKALGLTAAARRSTRHAGEIRARALKHPAAGARADSAKKSGS